MKKAIGLLILILFVCSNSYFAGSKNVIKTSVVPIFYKNYSLYFERGIHKNISFSFGGSYMPERGLPNFLVNKIGNGSISNIKFSGISLIPEIRIFPGVKIRKQAPEGFYISIYAKMSSFNIDFPYSITDTSGTYSTTFDFSGKFNGIGIGMMFGRQWILGDHFAIDWWISGAHVGSLNSTLDVANDNLSNIDQPEFISNLEGISFPQGEVNTTISGNTAKISIDAPFIGFRSGFTLGIAF